MLILLHKFYNIGSDRDSFVYIYLLDILDIFSARLNKFDNFFNPLPPLQLPGESTFCKEYTKEKRRWNFLSGTATYKCCQSIAPKLCALPAQASSPGEEERPGVPVIFSKFQLSSSSGLGLTVFGIYLN